MHYTIYKITNILNNKIYIGKHQTTNINDSYFGSGIALIKAIRKYGKENFTKEILFVFDNEYDMNQKEKELITEDFIKRNDTYNIGLGGEGGPHFLGKTHSEKTKQHISEVLLSKSTKENVKEGWPKEKGWTEDKRKIVSERIKSFMIENPNSNMGKYKRTEEIKNKICGRIYIHHPIEKKNKMIEKDKLNYFESNGWKIGRIYWNK